LKARIALFALSVLLLAACGRQNAMDVNPEEVPTVTFTVKVIDKGGRPVAHAPVIPRALFPIKLPVTEELRLTGERGEMSFNREPGPYEIFVGSPMNISVPGEKKKKLPKYEPIKKKIVVKEGTFVEIQLVRKK
jgi:hypothetical protein